MCDFVPNIPAVYNGTLPFFKCWPNIKQHFICITTFKVLKKMHKKNNKKMSEVAVWEGGGSGNFRHCLKFYAFF